MGLINLPRTIEKLKSGDYLKNINKKALGVLAKRFFCYLLVFGVGCVSVY